ncbi:hypothetical protein CNR22_10375 [Sphingobacteriaceae bacterium]|nr:hypothetical protein CNR22_10375 [Sphingobacteriaceae bacterium]
MKKTLSLLLLFTAFFVTAQTQVTGTIKNVDAETFKKLIDQKSAVLIDLRTNDEINAKGKIAGAKQIDFLSKDSEKEIAKLDKSKTYLIYCAGGGRSGDCAELMQKTGFKEIINLEKGYDDWKRKGFETVK